jgi:hypothetical protein
MNGHRPAVAPVRVCYYLQTHTKSEQILRLVELIKQGSPDSVVLIDHDRAGSALDLPRLASLRNVHVIMGNGSYGDFSHLDRYFAVVDWLDEHGVEVDWIQNLSGQDYPLRPIADIERTLSLAEVDGFLHYSPIFPERTPADADWGVGPAYRLTRPFDTKMRFEYRHRRVGRPSATKQRWLRPIMALNLIQPWLRVSLAFSTIAVRRRKTIFDDKFICYGGMYFCTLSTHCVRYVRKFAIEHPEIVEYFRDMAGPEELFMQTVLINSGRFTFVPKSSHYIDFSNSRDNHPKTLGVEDLDLMLASGAFWARKFDTTHDSAVLDVLDRRVRTASTDEIKWLQSDEEPALATSGGERELHAAAESWTVESSAKG